MGLRVSYRGKLSFDSGSDVAVHRSGKHRAIPFILGLCLLGTGLGEAPARAAEPRKAAETLIWEGTDPSVLPTLDHLLGAWESATSADRAEMARIFAVLGFGRAVPALIACAGGQGPESVSCTLALVAMGRTEAAPVLREQLRTSEDPEVIAVAGLTLAAWRDHFSYSLLVKALMEGRGGELGGIALVLSMDRLGNRLELDYMRFARIIARYPLVRLTATARLAGRLSGWRAGAINRELRQTLAARLEGEAWSDDARLAARLSAWGLSRAGEGGCTVLLRRLLENHDAGGHRAERVLDLLPELNSDCLRQARAAAPPLFTAASAAGLAGRERSPAFPLPALTPRLDTLELVDSLIGLSNRFALWGRGASVAEFAKVTEELAEVVLPTPGRWDALSIVGMPIKSRVKRTLWKELEARWDGTRLPPDFDRFDPAYTQPDWYPETLEITIDDGPRPKRLVQILDVLKSHGVRATFFFVGSNLMIEWMRDSDRLRELLQRLVRDGHAIGYHSMDHDTTFLGHLQAWLPPQVADDVALFKAILELALGHPYPLIWSRAPGGMGARNPWLRDAFNLAGLRASVPWTVDPEAWPPGISSRKVRTLARGLDKKGGEQIILLHETNGLARELDAFLGELREIWEEGDGAQAASSR
jgi:peptidoglycan/xylan/chitin deacetylase (PgdA/CDA1 family)